MSRLASPLRLLAASTAVFLVITCQVDAAPAKVAATPPMGWNSWNHFHTSVTDADVRATADLLVSTGMRDVGYTYVNIDDSWQGERDSGGMLHANSKFPDMKALSAYVHSKGFKLGLYSSPGPQTCGGYAGSYQHETQDAALYAEWGVDFLKYDLCTLRPILDRESAGDRTKYAELEKAAYTRMHDALTATGRPFLYSICQYGLDKVWEWGPKVGANMWRTTGDISDNADRMFLIGFSQAGLESFAGPGHWNDPDMLEIGNGGMTLDESRFHMALWAMLAAPLLAGNDLTKMTPEVLAILTNREVIAVDQDALGIQGKRISETGPQQIWVRPLADGSRAIALFNGNEAETVMVLDLATVQLSSGVTLHNLWDGTKLTAKGGHLSVMVPGHGVVLLRAKG